MSQTINLIDAARSEGLKDMSKWQRARAVTHLLKHLDGEQKQANLVKAVDLVLSIRDEFWLQSALKEIAPYLEGKLLEQMFGVVLKIVDGRVRAEVMMSLLDKLPQAFISQVLEASDAIAEPDLRASLLIAISRKMEGEQRSNLLAQAYEIALLETDQQSQIRLFAQLAELGVADSSIRGIEVANSFLDVREKAWALSFFQPPLENEVLYRSRQELLTRLNDLRSKKRSELFWCFCDKSWVNLNLLTVNQLTSLLNDLLDVCQNWRWFVYNEM